MIRAVLLSNFDVHVGPTVALSVPALDKAQLKGFDAIPKLIDLTDTEGFFISTLENTFSANYYFSIENENIRGNKDLLLLSIAVQVQGMDDKEKLLLFMEKNEDSLRHYVRGILENVQINELGIFSPENAELLKDSLHQFFNVVFNKESFDALFKEGQDRIAVFSPKGFDTRQVMDFFRKALRKEKKPSLKTRMVMNAIDEFSFNPFSCNDRQSGSCMKDLCPPCMELARESDAAIFMFDSGTFNLYADFADMADYLKSIDATRHIPVLVMQIDGDSHVDGTGVYEEFTALLQEAIEKNGFKMETKHARVPIGNVDAFRDSISWLIKAII
jgi:hypothetical protein